MVGYYTGSYILQILAMHGVSFEVPCGKWAGIVGEFETFKPIIVFYASLPRGYIDFRVI